MESNELKVKKSKKPTNKELTEEIELLKITGAKLSTEKGALKQQLAKATSEINNLRAENVRLTEENGNLRSAIQKNETRLNDSTSALTNTVESLKETNKTLATKLNEKISQLEKALNLALRHKEIITNVNEFYYSDLQELITDVTKEEK